MNKIILLVFWNMSRTGFFTLPLVQKLLKNYGLCCNSFNENALGVMGLTTTIKVKKQKFVLKVFKNWVSKKQILFDISIMDFLYLKKFPVPKVISGLNNKKIFKMGKQYYVLLECVFGKHKSKKQMTPAEVINFAETLATMHLLLKNFSAKGRKAQKDLFDLTCAKQFQKQHFPALRKLILNKKQQKLFKQICGKNLLDTVLFCENELNYLQQNISKKYKN